MPLLDYKLFVLDCKIFCFGKFTRPHPDRLTQDNITLHDKYCFSVSALHMDVYGSVVVTVEEESESVFGEYSLHGIDFLR
jgi:hypothetical protein